MASETTLAAVAGATSGQLAGASTGRVEVTVHDASRLAWQVTVPLPEQGRAPYRFELEVEAPANLVGSLDPWAALQSYARLDGADDSDLAGRGSLETFRRAVVGVSGRLAKARDGFVRHTTMTCTSVDADEGHVRPLLLWLEVASTELAAARTKILVTAPEAEEGRLADEFLSGQLWIALTDCERALEGARHALPERAPSTLHALGAVESALVSALKRELAYRRDRQLALPVNAQQLQRLLSRMRWLKKHFERVLFLEVESYQVVSRWAGWVSALMAMLAYLWFLLWQLTLERHPAAIGSGVIAFALVTAVAYASRERLKEIGRDWLAGRVQRVFAQRVMRCRLPAHNEERSSPVLLSARESFSRSTARRPDPVHPECGATHEVLVLRFAHRGLLGMPAGEGAIGQEVRLVYRLDLSSLFPRLHDAVRGLATLDEEGGALAIVDVPRNYELPVRISLRWTGGDERASGMLVLNKNGLLRVEDLAA
jgi:hypothetical protein